MPQIGPQAGFQRSVDRSKKLRLCTRHIVSHPGLSRLDGGSYFWLVLSSIGRIRVS